MDSNAIISKAMKDRTSGKMVRAYQKLLKKLRLAGMTPKQHVLDNKMSNKFKDTVRMNEMEYKLVPKGQHCRNIAEKVIQTWKAHAISVFSDMDSKCPLFPLGLDAGENEHASQYALAIKYRAKSQR